MKNQRLLEGLTKEAESIVRDFVESGGLDYPNDADTSLNPSGLYLAPDVKQLAGNLAQAAIWDTEEQLCLAFLFKLEEQRKIYFFLGELLGRQQEVLSIAAELEQPPEMDDLAKSIPSLGLSYFFREDPSPEQPFTSPFGNIHWNYIDWSKTLSSRGDFLRAIARWRTNELIDMFANNDNELLAFIKDGKMHDVVLETERLDELFVNRAVQHFTTPIPNQDSSSRRDYNQRVFFQIKKLSDLRNNKYHDILSNFAIIPELVLKVHAIDVLLHQRPDIVLEAVSAELESNTLSDHNEYNAGDRTMDRLLRLAINQVDGKGAPLIRKVFARFGYGCASRLAKMLLENPAPSHATVIRQLLLDCAAALKNNTKLYFWEQLAAHDKGLLFPEWRAFAKGKSKPMREIATKWLLKHETENAMSNLDQLLASNAVADRLAGISLLESSATPEDLQRLQSIHQSEPTKQVRVAIAAALAKHQIVVPAEPEKQVEDVQDITSFESALLKRAKTIRLPKAPWLDFDTLPPLKTADGQELSKLATTYMFQCQARAKPGMIMPEVEVLLPYLNRGENPAFVRLLLDQWFASDMKSATRWALVIVGITGDDSVIKRLVEPIPAWCRANLKARAEWVIHTLSLLASEKAMVALDELTQKFRTQRAYVGKAAATAMESIATKLGTSKDELSERLVPTSGFDSEGSREFAAVGGTAIAQLGLDFKIAWKDPGDGKLLKKPSALLTPDADSELKDVRKTIKQAISLQTARLQDAMIIGRRWDIPTWQHRFENHPLFRVFAMRLVWGVYDDAGSLINTFRLYPNGLTASANGALEEFAPPAKNIGIVHALELDEIAKEEWARHLTRFKIKPPFPQIFRDIHTPDPLHGNRKELRETEDVKTTAGKLRSELYARGWSQESAGDGGWIYNMVRMFPAYGIRAYLQVENLHAASSNDEDIVLGCACFALEPDKEFDDSEAIRFDQIPPVVFSETLSDLKALIATTP